MMGMLDNETKFLAPFDNFAVVIMKGGITEEVDIRH